VALPVVLDVRGLRRTFGSVVVAVEVHDLSSRVKTVQEASQLGSIVVLPLVVVLLAQLGGRLHLGVPQALLLGATGVLLRIGQRWCSRESLLTRT
jgi:DMSO reductase anchor subunit